jgi:hypothetical protein
MERPIRGSTRRGLLGRGAALLVGALGVGAATGDGAAAATRPIGVLTLYGRGFHIHSPGRRAGAMPAQHDAGATYGELLAGRGGEKVGEFRAGFLALGTPFGPGKNAPGTLEQHVFDLKEGSIIGLGSATAGKGAFAIVGGTGRYQGARGSYVAHIRPRELGGNGSAEFTLDLVTWEGR